MLKSNICIFKNIESSQVMIDIDTLCKVLIF